MKKTAATTGALMVMVLGLAACSGTDEDPAGQSATSAESGMVLEVPDVSGLATTDATTPGDAGTVVMPTGTLTIERVSTVETVPAQIGDDATSAADDETLRPADGEVFRLVQVRYSDSGGYSSTGQDADHEAEMPGSPMLSLSTDGQTQELGTLGSEHSEQAYIASVPAEGDASLVVSQAGHDQTVDLTTGERTPDDIAAAYYRDTTHADIEETLQIPTGHLELTGAHSGDTTKEVALNVDLSDAQIGAWDPEEGWAEPDTAWMHLSGSIALDLSGSGEVHVTNANVRVTVTPDAGDPIEVDIPLDETSTARLDMPIAVPVDIESFEITVDAEVDTELGGSWEYRGDSTVNLESEPLVITVED